MKGNRANVGCTIGLIAITIGFALRRKGVESNFPTLPGSRTEELPYLQFLAELGLYLVFLGTFLILLSFGRWLFPRRDD